MKNSTNAQLSISAVLQDLIYINIKWFFGIFALAEDDIIRIVCCDNINIHISNMIFYKTLDSICIYVHSYTTKYNYFNYKSVEDFAFLQRFF